MLKGYDFATQTERRIHFLSSFLSVFSHSPSNNMLDLSKFAVCSAYCMVNMALMTQQRGARLFNEQALLLHCDQMRA